jgi:hypothetical protein
MLRISKRHGIVEGSITDRGHVLRMSKNQITLAKQSRSNPNNPSRIQII